jgi:lycopene cyclase domain-containing protein
LFESKKHAAVTLGSLFIIGSILDSFALIRGYWSYQQQFFVGITIGVMPLEEYIFMIVIPFLTIVVYRLATMKTI